MNSGCFKKGHVPWNKGREFEAGGKSRDTRFKKGHVPHNSRKDGDIRIVKKKGDPPYKQIRLSPGVWKLVHRINWEAKNGPIPKGNILVCKSGDTLNCDPDNWECITRAENLARNENRKKGGKTMRKTWEKAKTLEAMGFGHWSKLNNR